MINATVSAQAASSSHGVSGSVLYNTDRILSRAALNGKENDHELFYGTLVD